MARAAHRAAIIRAIFQTVGSEESLNKHKQAPPHREPRLNGAFKSGAGGGFDPRGPSGRLCPFLPSGESTSAAKPRRRLRTVELAEKAEN